MIRRLRTYWLACRALSMVYGVSAFRVACMALLGALVSWAERHPRTLVIAAPLVLVAAIGGLFGLTYLGTLGRVVFVTICSLAWLCDFHRHGYSWSVSVAHVSVLGGLYLYRGPGNAPLFFAWLLWCWWLCSRNGRDNTRKLKQAAANALTGIQQAALSRQVSEAT